MCQRRRFGRMAATAFCGWRDVSDDEVTAREEAARASLRFQHEYFADDVDPPDAAQEWSEAELRRWFEAGGGSTCAPALDQSPEVVVPMGEWCAIATILTALVPLSIYFVSGKLFVRGIAAGAVKG